MTLDIGGLPRDVQRPFEQLLDQTLDTGGRRARIRFGTDTISLTASSTGSVGVVHGLGSTRTWRSL